MVDQMIACSHERGRIILDGNDDTDQDESKNNNNIRCGVLTDMINLATHTKDSGPDAIMMEPIYPALNPTKLVGFVVSSIVWRESLEKIFSEDVSGIDCVLRTSTETFTFHVTNGIASVKGRGDFHETAFDDYLSDIDIVTVGDFSNTSATYRLELYPTFEFYTTNNAIVGLVGTMAIILVISVLFFFYDSFVRQEFDANAELLEAKRRFVRFVSHEVRTPLNTVCMGLALLQDDIRGHCGRTMPPPHDTETQRLDARQQEQANLPTSITVKQEDATEWINLSEEVLGNTQAAVNVLNDLLNYDKIQRGKLSLELTVIPVWALVENTVKEFNLMAAEKGICLQLIFAKDLLALGNGDNGGTATTAALLDKRILDRVVLGDVSRISMMLRNLLSNALKFTPEKGSLTVHVSVAENLDAAKRSSTMSLRTNRHNNVAAAEKSFELANGETLSLPPRGCIEIRVFDTGVGMKESQLKRVFHDGVQFGANKLQSGGGSGLGMFIAKSIVEQHEGTLELPLFLGPQSAAVASPQPNSNTVDTTPSSSIGTTAPLQHPNPQDFSPQRILVVDDAAPNRKLLIRLLQNRGHSCDGAEDGKEAVECVKRTLQNPYDTILLDNEMPVMNGPTACRQMRELGCSSFVAGVTGNLLPEDVAHFKNYGANAVLPKPFKMASLEQLWVEYGITGGSGSCRGGSKDGHDEENAGAHELGSGNNSKTPNTVSFNMELMEP